MLKPAQLYIDQLTTADVATWYDMSSIYWHSGTGCTQINVSDSTHEIHQFVSVDKDDRVIGYITYSVDWCARSVYQMGMVSYDKGNILFIKDLLQCIHNIFHVYNLNRIEWYSYADNPAIDGYRKFINKYGGREVGMLHSVAMLMDGKIHDSVIFEILKSDIKRPFVKE